ncbi:hypothetical protein TVAG_089800 [Trichomonas vaginalis G3]|uniref:Uncharacterized protein n=2 Tax=Trichomonas vaginalis (strain ATCC PRA-98 / G3) TaxID=412133 RepID=A2G9V2_TRIV3|nr:hypothetical protein TVAG_089800 [Trichomonas vaginalis G3]|eukprot:XP_001298996.1 hypothetical protein [Trichomonas vaginalis G3]
MELTAQNQAIPQLRQRAAELQVENEKDDTKQMEELGVATAELKALRQKISNVKNSQDSKKNVKLEQQLDTLFDQSRKLDKELAELEKIDKEYSDQEGPVDTQIAALIEHNNKIKALSEKVTRGRDYILRMLEEEARIHQLERMIEKASGELPELETLINNLENEKVSKLSEMRRITADIDAVIEKIKAGDHEHNERYRLLNKVSNQLQEVNDLTRNEKARVADIQIQYVKKAQDAVAEAEKIQQKIEEYKKKISDFPEFKKAALVDLQTKVTKAKQLTDQLEQKRKELRNQIQQKILSSDIIVNLNKAMEEEWYNRQVLVDEENALKKELQKYTDTLKRKKLCSDEIERMFPRKNKPHKGPGIAELEHMYDQTLILNKKLAEAADDLREELEIHKNDYKLLRSFYEEGEKPAAK